MQFLQEKQGKRHFYRKKSKTNLFVISALLFFLQCRFMIDECWFSRSETHDPWDRSGCGKANKGLEWWQSWEWQRHDILCMWFIFILYHNFNVTYSYKPNIIWPHTHILDKQKRELVHNTSAMPRIPDIKVKHPSTWSS